MANKKITDLGAGTPKATDLFVCVDVTDTTMAPTGTNKKYTRSAMDASILGQISLAGDVAGPMSATVIQANAVTNSKAAQMAANTLKGNNTGVLADPKDLTASEVRATIGLGTMSVQDANSVTITGGTITGTSISATALTVTSFATSGVVHNDASGVLSTSLIVNADVSASAGIVDTKLATISTAGKVANSATTATTSNTPSTIVLRDGSGNFSAGTITGTLSGTATNFSGSLSGDITGTQSATVITPGIITNAMISSSAGIIDTKLATISAAGKVANTATTATALNTPSTIVLRDGSGNFAAGTITATLSGTATNFSGSLSGDVTGTQSATVIAADAVTNAKLANMAANTFKANNTAGSADPTDITVAQAKTMLGISGSTTIAATQIGFGDASSNLVGSANFTWNESTKVMNLASGSEINLGASVSARKFVLYQPAGTPNNFQFYGFGVAGNEVQYYSDQTASDHVFYAGLTTTTKQEVARITGDKFVTTASGGGVKFGNSTASYTPTALDYYEELTMNFTVGGCWSNRTVSVKLTRIGKVVHMRFSDLTAATVTANDAIQGSTAIPARFLSQGIPSQQNGIIFVTVNGTTKPGLFLMATPNFSITDSDQTFFAIGESVGIRSSCVTWICS